MKRPSTTITTVGDLWFLSQYEGDKPLKINGELIRIFDCGTYFDIRNDRLETEKKQCNQ